MPTPISSGESYAFYLGDGATTTFALGFEFLEPEHVKVEIEGALQTVETDYSLVNGEVVFVVPPDLDADIRLVRETPIDFLQRKVDFREYGAITEDEMTLNQKQIWYLIQEAKETDDSGNVNPNAEYLSWDDIRSRWTARRSSADQRIGDVADPVEGSEAATKDYVDSIAEWGIAGVPQGWTFTTIAGVTNYTLTNGELLDPHYCIVSIDGVLQVPLTDFTIIQGAPSSTIQLLSPPPAAGLTLSVLNFGKTRFINISEVGANSVGTAQLQSRSVTEPKYDDDSIPSRAYQNGSVLEEHLGVDSVGETKIQDNAVTFDHLKEAGFTSPAGGGIDQFLKIDEGTGALSKSLITAADISDWLASLAGVRLNQFAVPNGPINLNNQKISNLQDPTGGASSDAATKGYVDGIVGSGIGAKIDQVFDTSLATSSTNWLLFSSPPSWWTDSTYLYYEFIFSNWRWLGGGKVLLRMLQTGTWREDLFWDTDPGLRSYSVDEPLTWSVRIYNPRTGADKPTASSGAVRWSKAGFVPIVFGSVDGLEIRGETSSIQAGARVQVYGHRAAT